MRLQNDSDFETTVVRFQKFLGQNSYSENIVWLTPEDVLMSGKQFVYVRVPIPSANAANARQTYEQGVVHGRGLLICTICEMEASTCCYVWYPKREEDKPQGLWPHDGSAKLVAKTRAARIPGKPVKNRLLWEFLKLWHRRQQGSRDFLFS
jgi:hypothetical protein